MAKVLAIGVALAAVLAVAPVPGFGQEAPVVPNDRPMRFVLTAGAEVVGTRVGEDAETFTVQTANGLVRVRKVDIAVMDHRTGGTAPSPPPVVAPGLAPPVVASATVVQGASLVALIAGIAIYSRSEPAQASAPPRFALVPLATPEDRGVSLSLRL